MLIIEVCKRDKVNAPDELVEEIARSLAENHAEGRTRSFLAPSILRYRAKLNAAFVLAAGI
ncbi:MAG: hypothetical protein R3B96_14790 [Pirellulaceae bacterium]